MNESQNFAFFIQYLNLPIPQEKLDSILNIHQDSINLLWQNLTTAANQLKLPLEARHTTLAELRQRGGSAFVRLRDPDQLVLLAAIGTQNTLAFHYGEANVINNDTLNKRFTGQALILAHDHNDKSALVFDNSVHVIEIDTLGSRDLVEKVSVTNRGQKIINLRVAGTSCGCTGAEVVPGYLLPGQTGIVNMKMHSEGQNKLVTVTLRTTDPQWSVVTIALVTKMPKTTMRPPTALFIGGQLGQATSEITTLMLPSTTTVTKITTQHPFITAKIESIESTVLGKLYHVKVSLAEDAPAGSFADEVAFDLKDAEMPHVVIPITGYVNASITSSPSAILLGSVAYGAIIRRSIVLQSPAKQAFALKSAQSKNPQIKISAISNIMAMKHTITIEIPIVGVAGSAITDRIEVVLTDDRVLDIDIFGTTERKKE